MREKAIQYIESFMDGQNQDVEAHLVLATFAILTFLLLSAYSVVWLQTPFNAQDFGVGVGAAFAGVGAWGWGQGKQRREEATATAIVARSDRADVLAETIAETKDAK